MPGFFARAGILPVVLLVSFSFSSGFFSRPLRGQGLTSESPQVVRAVDRAVAFLKKNGPREGRLGGKALICMALIKAGVPPDFPFIEATIREIRTAIATDGKVDISDHIYTAGLIVLFLAELEPDRYRRELDALARYLQKHQRRDGSWTYLTSGSADNYPSGDMSMTQYALMALWTLHQHGFEISGDSINRAGRWLTSIQNPEGGYAYQTTVSPEIKPTSWDGVRLSMTAAGLASVYVCRDLFGYNRKKDETETEKVHEAFSAAPGRDEYDKHFLSVSDFRFSVPRAAFHTAQARGNLWLERHFFPISLQTEYFFYYLYALERYGAFRELAEEKHHESPPWYDKTAVFLLSNQSGDGSWSGNLGLEVDTAYAVLFLLRSTHRTFEKIKSPNRFGGGNLLGGRGLPRLTDDIRIEEGQVISLSEIAGSEQLMERLADLEEVDDETLTQLAELPAEEVENLLNRNKARIKKLVGHEKAERRLAAVTLLGKSGDVSHTPTLIYALTDPDPDVARAAWSALLRLARIPEGEAFPEGDDPSSLRKREQLIERWKNWYRRIDPDARFEDR